MSRFLVPAVIVGFLALALDLTYHQILSLFFGPQPHMITNILTESSTPIYFTTKFLVASFSAFLGFQIFGRTLGSSLFTAFIFTMFFLLILYLLGLGKYYSLVGFYHIGHFIIVFVSAYLVSILKGGKR